MSDQEPKCSACGHALVHTEMLRTFIDIVRRIPAHAECAALIDDGGNGWSGGNTPCGCRHKSHAAETVEVPPPRILLQVLGLDLSESRSAA